MPTATNKNTAALRVKKSGDRQVYELLVQSGTRRSAIKDLAPIWKEAVRRFDPQGCLACISGRDFIIKEGLERVLPAALDASKTLPKNVVAVDIRTGKIR